MSQNKPDESDHAAVFSQFMKRVASGTHPDQARRYGELDALVASGWGNKTIVEITEELLRQVRTRPNA
ncbi:hypothetical protein SAMN06265795_102259 [Noviherbaspirillum humi]|uniref:Uncharacterized protein n=1 Tax=Noviherbaspirillum humi TaxID=1688639 RepID=A0A239DNR8_9BURK|nr:hypothetical protein [Noviherbaspirillum humi]SNS33383.1 hypothetical protein SAMN06265795_102259 [Noviherbaspirillum humi]